MKLTLYHLPGSRSLRVRWLLEELGLSYTLKTIDIFKGEGNTAEYLAVHPLGQLPAIKIDDRTMFESGAIVQWLADTNLEKGFAPTLDSPNRRDFEQWMYFSVSNLETPAWEIMLHSKILPKESAIKEIIPFATKNLLQVFTILDSELKNKDHIVDDTFSAADIMIGYILMWYPEHVEHFSNLKSYVHDLQQRPAYNRSIQN